MSGYLCVFAAVQQAGASLRICVALMCAARYKVQVADLLLGAVQVVINIFAHVFREEDGPWDVGAMQSALRGKYQHVSYGGSANDDGVLACFINCINPKQP